MLTGLALTHLGGATIHVVAGAWTTPRGRTISHCTTCGDAKNSASSASPRRR